jgi:hypothetical protein
MFLTASDTPTNAALKPSEFCKSICKCGHEVGSRFAVETLGSD